MELSTGRYHGAELTDLPTDYLEWAVGHLTMSDAMEGAVVAEIARRANEARVESETPAERFRDRISEVLTKFAAKHGL